MSQLSRHQILRHGSNSEYEKGLSASSDAAGSVAKKLIDGLVTRGTRFVARAFHNPNNPSKLPAQALTGSKRKRTKNPVVDGLVGVEPNPGPPKSAKVHAKNNKSGMKKNPKRPSTASKSKNQNHNSTVVASSAAFVPSYSVSTYMETVSTTKDTIRIKGQQAFGVLATAASTVPGTILASQYLGPGTFDNTRFAPYFTQYERYVINSFSIKCLPDSGSNVGGTYIMFVEPDPEDVPSPFDTLNVPALLNNGRAVESTVWGKISQARAFVNKSIDFYTKDFAAESLRLSDFGGFVAAISKTIATNTTIGTLYLEADITFKIPVEGAEPTSILRSYAYSPAGAAEASTRIATVAAGVTNVTFPISQSVVNGGIARSWAAANPSNKFLLKTSMSRVDAFQFPILTQGEYLIRCCLQLTSASTIPTATNEYSRLVLSSPDAVVTAFPQYTATGFTTKHIRSVPMSFTSSAGPPTPNSRMFDDLMPVAENTYVSPDNAVYFVHCTGIFRVHSRTGGSLTTGASLYIEFQWPCSATASPVYLRGFGYTLLRLVSSSSASLIGSPLALLNALPPSSSSCDGTQNDGKRECIEGKEHDDTITIGGRQYVVVTNP